MRRPSMVLALVACASMFALPAFAQDTTGISADSILDIVQPYIAEIVSILIAAIVAFVARQVQKYTGIQIEAKHREALQSALENAARIVLGNLEAKAKGSSVSLGSAYLDAGVKYVLKSVPDAVSYFGLSPERIGELIRPKLIPKA